MSLQDLLAELQKEYLASITDKVSMIETLWRGSQLEELETEFHKMKGTGSTYGLPEISQLGEAMERLCEINRPALDNTVPLAMALLSRIQAQRQRGEAFAIEADPDFRIVQNTVIASIQDPRKSPPS
jgi:HPt (histidine-containing phosphotransfer) domain-containing protein